MTPQMREDFEREMNYEKRQWKRLNEREKREWLDILSTFVGWGIFFLATAWGTHAAWVYYVHG